MKVRTWHVGKIVMLWAWGVAVIVVVLYVLREYKRFLTEHVLFGFALLSLPLVIPLALSILTWRWLSGKEVGAHESAAREKSAD